MERSKVYELIDGERVYQDNLGPDRSCDAGQDKPVGEWVLLMVRYANRAMEAWTDNAGDEKALDEVRKVAGIAVHCMEEHGAPKRQ